MCALNRKIPQDSVLIFPQTPCSRPSPPARRKYRTKGLTGLSSGSIPTDQPCRCSASLAQFFLFQRREMQVEGCALVTHVARRILKGRRGGGIILVPGASILLGL